MKRIAVLLILLSGWQTVYSQESLLDEISSEPDPQSVVSTFKGTRLINGHSVETRAAGVLEFVISHRFGEVSGGFYELFGLDDSNIRFGLEYGVTDRLYIGVGRSSFEKVFDGFVKYRLVRQTRQSTPVSVTAFTSATVKTLRQPELDLDFADKLVYTTQVMVARKFSDRLSLQVMPTWIHYNLISPIEENNEVFAIGAGGRYRVSRRVSINAEYYYQIQRLSPDSYNSIAIGVDIETGGHVFQIQLTNSRQMIEKGFIAETDNNFFKGDIHLGFNITRAFQLKKS